MKQNIKSHGSSSETHHKYAYLSLYSKYVNVRARQIRAVNWWHKYGTWIEKVIHKRQQYDKDTPTLPAPALISFDTETSHLLMEKYSRVAVDISKRTRCFSDTENLDEYVSLQKQFKLELNQVRAFEEWCIHFNRWRIEKQVGKSGSKHQAEQLHVNSEQGDRLHLMPISSSPSTSAAGINGAIDSITPAPTTAKTTSARATFASIITTAEGRCLKPSDSKDSIEDVAADPCGPTSDYENAAKTARNSAKEFAPHVLSDRTNLLSTHTGRSKEARMHLHGCTDSCCKGYWNKAALTEESGHSARRRDPVQDFSRHRAQYKGKFEDPKDYWVMGMPDTQRVNLIHEAAQERRRHREKLR